MTTAVLVLCHFGYPPPVGVTESEKLELTCFAGGLKAALRIEFSASTHRRVFTPTSSIQYKSRKNFRYSDAQRLFMSSVSSGSLD